MIRIRNLRKKFGSQTVLDGVNLDIEDGKTTAIIGPSGTGKSVLLKIITGLLPADSGDVIVGEDSMTAAKRTNERLRIASRMGVLFQAAALFDSLNLFDNVAFPLRERCVPEAEVRKRVTQRLEEVALRDCALAFPGEVSIGMRKRVGIARALVTNPQILLFDEPNTGLDPQTGQEIYELINETQQASGFTGIVISHEIPEIFQVCDRVAMLYMGRIQEEGTVEEFLRSRNPVVKQFVAGEVEGPIQIS